MDKPLILCKDMDCKFKCKRDYETKCIDECGLNLQIAISCFNKFGITTCELGTGDVELQNVPPYDLDFEKIIETIKKRGRV
jgi:hypothetical protein